MRLFVFFFSLIAALHVQAQETRFITQEITTGLKEEYNARVSDTTIRENGYKSYYNNVLFSEGQYTAGERTGVWKFYHYPSGKLEYSYDYTLKQFAGDFKRYDDKNNLELSCTYSDGVREGEQRYYYEDGTLMEVTGFVKGKKNGTYKYFGETGKTEIEKKYLNGTLDGISTYYHAATGNVILKLEYQTDKLLNILALNDSTGKPLNPGTLKNGNGTRNYYHRNNMLRYSYTYKNGIPDGAFSEYRMDGSLYESGNFLNEKRIGVWNFFLPDKTVHSTYNFDNGELILFNKEADEKLPESERKEIARLQKRETENQLYMPPPVVNSTAAITSSEPLIDNKVSGEEIFIAVESPARFPGGDMQLMLFLRSNITYPVFCKEHQIKGISYISFVVERDGTISNIKTIKSAHKLLDEEAMRVISLMPRWQPGIMQGVPVRVSCNVPIRFALR